MGDDDRFLTQTSSRYLVDFAGIDANAVSAAVERVSVDGSLTEFC